MSEHAHCGHCWCMLRDTDLRTLAGAYTYLYNIAAHSYVPGHTMNPLLINQGDLATLRHMHVTM